MQQLVKIKTASHSSDSSSILIIYAGGTLGMVHDGKGTLLKPFNFNQILEKMPELNGFEMELTIVSIKEPMDSANFDPEQWIEIGTIISNNYNDFDGFVVLHGTDTMAYTASALGFQLENLNKPVILTGAQLPLGVPRTDARENFITSLEIASEKHPDGTPFIREVCIYFDYYLFRGNRAKKVQSNRFEAFASENYPFLAEAGVTINYNSSAIKQETFQAPLKFSPYFLKDIAVIKLYPGIQQDHIENVLSSERIKGVILETFGAGNGPNLLWFYNVLRKATDRGIVIMNISQCLGGKVIQGKYETSHFLIDAGVISGGDITFEAAIVKMMFVLAHPEYSKNAKIYLSNPLRGEMEADILYQADFA